MDEALYPPITVPHKTDVRIFDPMNYVVDGEVPPLDRILYADDDVDVLIWWAEPGKTHLDIHKHPRTAHVFVVIEGEGEALLGGGHWEPVRPGHVIVNPREKVHALRNTMDEGRLVWLSASAVGAGAYQLVPASETET
jgi:quercetin dioxygenase-like cupin family protein